MRGQPLSDHLLGVERGDLDAALGRLFGGREPIEREIRVVIEGGNERWFVLRYIFIDKERAALVVTDITRRRGAEMALPRREEQLRQAQKLAALGRLSGHVAHDFNNLLTTILMAAESLRLQTRDPELVANLRLILPAVAQGRRLTSQLIALSRPQGVIPGSVEVNGCLLGMKELLERPQWWPQSFSSADLVLRLLSQKTVLSWVSDRTEVERALRERGVTSKTLLDEVLERERLAFAKTLPSPSTLAVSPGVQAFLGVDDVRELDRLAPMLLSIDESIAQRSRKDMEPTQHSQNELVIKTPTGERHVLYD